jgi:limonene-1,2-epoxide hydrolase
MKPTPPVTRARFLKWASLGPAAAAALALSPSASAADPTPAEKTNLKLVADFCAALEARDMARIATFLSDDCAYRVIETAPPARGKDAIESIRRYVERSTKIEIKILESWVKGPIVVNERIDTFVPPPANSPYHLTGVFFLRGGKIAEWTDYLIRTLPA